MAENHGGSQFFQSTLKNRLLALLETILERERSKWIDNINNSISFIKRYKKNTLFIYKRIAWIFLFEKKKRGREKEKNNLDGYRKYFWSSSLFPSLSFSLSLLRARLFYTRKSTHLVHFRSLLFHLSNLSQRDPERKLRYRLYSRATPRFDASIPTILLLLGFYISSRVLNSRRFYALKKKSSSVSCPKLALSSFPPRIEQSNSSGEWTIRAKEIGAFSGTKQRSLKRLRFRYTRCSIG